MKNLAIIMSLMALINYSYAEHSMSHEMQHGFVLSANDKFASHLVATGHHSRQVEVLSHLEIEDSSERETYVNKKLMNSDGHSYFLFQAQNLDLPSLKKGQILKGHIVESGSGKYEPKNIIVKNATLTVDQVLLNIENPFFKE